jgi:hypothetical protein
MGMMTAAVEIGRARRDAAVRRYDASRYSSAMAASDRALTRLEELNLLDRGSCRPDASAMAAIDRMVALLPAEARTKVKPWPTVQQALDGMFDVEEVLQAERRHDLYREEIDI